MTQQPCQGAEHPAAAGMEGGRRPTGVPAAADSDFLTPNESAPLMPGPPHPDPQVAEYIRRPRYSKEYKRSILRQIADCTQDGDVGRILRREGLYSSLVSSWRKAEKPEPSKGMAPVKPPASSEPSQPSLAQLKRENARLKAKLQQAELVLEIQKKASDILGISLKTLDSERSD